MGDTQQLTRVTEEIRQLAVDLPFEMAEQLSIAFSETNTGDWQRLRVHVIGTVSPSAVRQRVSAFIEMWQREAPDVSAQSVALGLLTAAQTEAFHRQHQRLELVWTGPDSRVIPLRRTDQALLQLIDSARERLHIVSFAVYKIEAIGQAIVEAVQRGVAVSIYLETPDASQGRIAFDTIGALGEEVVRCVHLYVWPLNERLRTDDGRYGSLHAKVAVADGERMLVSSANLTEYAMTLNMELGLLVHGGPLPGQVEMHLKRLAEMGVFQEVCV
jgi:phosphatidylserine/phosphatidylglycerophosphate/cardiolipin synthase-like enzyme